VQIEIQEDSSLIKNLKVKVSSSELEKDLEKYYQRERKKVKIDGFRKGKAPLNLVKRIYGKQIEARAMSDILGKYYTKAVEESELDILTEDEINVEKYSQEEGLEFSLRIEVKPEFNIPDFGGVTIEKKIPKVKEEEVDETIKRIRYSKAKREKSKGPVEKGDFVLLNIQEVDSKSLVPLVGKKWGDRYFRIGDEEIGPDFDEELIGLYTGDKKIIRRSGQEYMISQVQDGKTEEAFEVEVKEIDKVDLSPLNDEFAQKYNKKYKTVEDLREGIREKIRKNKMKQEDLMVNEKIVDRIVNNTDMKMPELFVEKYLDEMAKESEKGELENFDKDVFKEEIKSRAKKGIKWFLIKDELLKRYDIKVKESDIDKEIESYAKMTGEDEWRLKKYYSQEKNREKFIDDLEDRKLMEILRKEFNIKEVEGD